MKRIHIVLIALIALVGTSCLKSYEEKFDNSSAERAAEFLDSIQKMLCSAEYGWRMEYFFGNEDSDHGGINLTLEFAKPVQNEDGSVTYPDNVVVRSEEYETLVEKSRYVLRRDSGPVLCFDTFNSIMHKYGTASTDNYEGLGGDYEFFIVSNPEEVKDHIVLKGKRSGKFCYMYPLTESAAEYNKKKYDFNRDFYVNSFSGYINGLRVSGDIDVANHQFTASEMECYKVDTTYVIDSKTGDLVLNETGKPVIDHIDSLWDANTTITRAYILTDDGIRFYEPLELCSLTFNRLSFSFNKEKNEASFHSPEHNITWESYAPVDWLPYEFFEGTYTLTYSTNSNITNIRLVPEVPGDSYRVIGMSTMFDLLMRYNIRTGRLELRYQPVRKPGTNDVITENDDQLVVVLLPWALKGSSGGMWMNSNVGMTLVWNRDVQKPIFTWTENGYSNKFITTSFLLYYYNTDDTADSPYYDSADKYKFAGSGGSYQLANLKTFRKTN